MSELLFTVKKTRLTFFVLRSCQDRIADIIFFMSVAKKH
jgi:hypothetical protein